MLGILAPSTNGKGVSGHLRLACALFLICILLSPLKNILSGTVDWLNGGSADTLPGVVDQEEYEQELKEAMTASSKTYLTQLLIERLESEFAIKAGEVRCAIQWESGTEARPRRVSVILSGSAIWQDPERIENYVEGLLGCDCVSAIE